MGRKKKVVIAMSSGLDSSVSAMLLKEDGYEVIGLTGKMVNTQKADEICSKAKLVAEKIGIQHHTLDLTKDFKCKVIEYFENAYFTGETPNPCIACNKHIKWGKIFKYAKNELDADYFSTGHYANIKKDNEYYKLYPAKDDKKDQLYFLYRLTQEHLERTIFPLSEYTKNQVRELAYKWDLPPKSSKESQDICFIEKPETTKKYLSEKFGIKSGNFVDISNGEIIGKHEGHYYYTIGQRKGIGIAYPHPLYVIDIDAEKNIVYLGKKEYNYRNQLVLKDLTFSFPQTETEFDANIKIRYNMQAQKAHIKLLNDYAEVEFYEPISAITPGQAGVMYDTATGYLIGGGTVCW